MTHIISTARDRPHYDKDMKEMRLDAGGSESYCRSIKEHHTHNVVTYVPLSLQLERRYSIR